MFESTTKHLENYANMGLRTLVLARKILDEASYKRWSLKFKTAAVAVQNREDLLEEVNEEIEKNLELLGVTAVEDKLQPDVENTITFIKQAMIKIWVLTGDKLETAINIALSCHLFTNHMQKIILDIQSEEELVVKIESILEEVFFSLYIY